mgnify:FL=1
MPKLKAPFPYFGGKSRIADLVWSRLGDPDNYIEPFAGSCAVLLSRPSTPRIETINDADVMVSNFWRATSRDPEAVAAHADWPVSEIDMHARHRYLVLSDEAATFREKMRADPEHFDARFAGWWCWGLSCWIGGGWCSEPESRRITFLGGGEGTRGQGIHAVAKNQDRRRPHINGGEGQYGHGVHAKGESVTEKRPQLHTGNSEHGRGVHAKGNTPSDQVPTLTEGCVVHARGARPEDRQQVPRLDEDCGIVSRGRPQLADAYARGRGIHGNDQAEVCADRRAWLLDWFGRLRDRLRVVRVCCGHWLRVCDSPSVTTRLGTTAVFLDPPYPIEGNSRADKIYATDGAACLNALRDEVLAYCQERGADPRMRIAVCGYDTDGYALLEKSGWDCVAWNAQGGYGNSTEKGRANAGRERIWFSPACIRERTLFTDC